MAREVVISIWCDLCQSEDIKTEGEEMPPVAIGNAKPKVLALCKPHREDFFAPFVEALNDLGASSDLLVSGAAKRPGSTPVPQDHADGLLCPSPGCGTTLANTSSLRAHARRVHESTLETLLGQSSLLDAAGNVVDYRPRASKKPDVTEAACDVKGCDVVYTWPDNARPTQALGVHRRMKHGIAGPDSRPSRAKTSK